MNEKQLLYIELWSHLCRKADKLREDFNTARSLACSEWDESLRGGYEPVKILPEMTLLLRANFELLETEISRQKYYLTLAFKNVLGDDLPILEGSQANWEYWESKREETHAHQ